MWVFFIAVLKFFKKMLQFWRPCRVNIYGGGVKGVRSPFYSWSGAGFSFASEPLQKTLRHSILLQMLLPVSGYYAHVHARVHPVPGPASQELSYSVLEWKALSMVRLPWTAAVLLPPA